MRLDVLNSPAGTQFVFTTESSLEHHDLSQLADHVRPRSGISTIRAEQHIIFLAGLPTLRRVAELLREAAPRELQVAELAEQIGVPRERVSTALTTLKDSGLVERWHRAAWRWKGRR